MPKDQFSFDIVSEVDQQEVRNAVDQAEREIITRFDFKNTGTSVSRDEDLIELRSGTENRLKAAFDVLKEKMVRREVPLKALKEGPMLPAAVGGWVENRLANWTFRPVNGFTMNMCACAGVTLGTGGTCFAAASIFDSALASASGSSDSSAPDWSAWYSRDRDTASWMSIA